MVGQVTFDCTDNAKLRWSIRCRSTCPGPLQTKVRRLLATSSRQEAIHMAHGHVWQVRGRAHSSQVDMPWIAMHNPLNTESTRKAMHSESHTYSTFQAGRQRTAPTNQIPMHPWHVRTVTFDQNSAAGKRNTWTYTCTYTDYTDNELLLRPRDKGILLIKMFTRRQASEAPD